MKILKLALVIGFAGALASPAAPSSAQDFFENLRNSFKEIGKPDARQKPPPARAERERPKLFDSIKRAFNDLGASQPGVKLPAKYARQTVRYRTNEAPGTIIIDPREHFLYYVLGGDRAIRYGVGVGREGFGWHGTVRIGRKAEWPGWTPPPAMIARERKRGITLPAHMEGGMDNPLGARALYLYNGSGDTAYRIHGSNEPWTIGRNVSSGCFRMTNKDVIDLYKRANIGAKVIVR